PQMTQEEAYYHIQQSAYLAAQGDPNFAQAQQGQPDTTMVNFEITDHVAVNQEIGAKERAEFVAAVTRSRKRAMEENLGEKTVVPTQENQYITI
ncbi:hypothetical protein KI387_040327, partial [Taxus chinensis]